MQQCKNSKDSKTHALFEQVYPQAQRKYDEGEALVSLNKPLAHDAFRQAQKILVTNEEKFPKGSDEAKQIQALLTKVNSQIGSDDASTAVTKTATAKDAPLLGALQKTPDTLYAAVDTNMYIASETTIFSVDKSGKATPVIKNTNLWKSIGGLGTYGSNVYVLDKQANQINKFVEASAESKSNYLVDGTTADFSKATAMTIDTSVYVLFSDGSIKKYTRGKAESFSVSGLSTPLKNPTRIFTNTETDHLYILDNGNNRVVVLDKNGSFQTAHSAPVIKNAKEFQFDRFCQTR